MISIPFPLKKISVFDIRSTLYMPSIQENIHQCILNENKNGGADALVFCFEDAINLYDIPQGIENMNNEFKKLVHEYDYQKTDNKKPHLFIRVRDFTNYQLLMRELSDDVIKNIDGIVLPKFNVNQINSWEKEIRNTHFYVMPTLETEEYFIESNIYELFSKLKNSPLQERTLVVRFGGNDFLRGLAMKRPYEKQLPNSETLSKLLNGYPVGQLINPTIYDTPLLSVINNIMKHARQFDFEVTAPVFEYFNLEDQTNVSSMLRELALDQIQGFVGKTAIHPKQCKIINQFFNTLEEDKNVANAIYQTVQEQGGTPQGGVSNHCNTMIEPTTHYKWALRLLNK